MPNRNRQVLLKRRPTGAPTPADFDIVDGPMPDPGEGEVLVRGIYLSLDPYMRGRISGARSYAKPVEVGAVMEGRVVGQVVRSCDPGFREGDFVLGGYGWQAYSAVPGAGLLQLDPAEAPLSTALSVLGMPGLTAYIGLSEIGRPQRGETVVVSAASGAVGAVAGQLVKRSGARVVGIAGGADKCRYVEAELGFDACIDHRAADLDRALDRACPNGIDVYWENVGGAVQQAVFPRLNDFGRMVMCGMVAEYNDVEPRPGPNLMSAVRKRLRIQGFIVSDQWQRFAEYRSMAAPLLKSGELKYREDMVDGLDRAPEAFIGLLQGRNFGKLVVRLGDDPTRGARV
ncbi:MAG: NADP-dependent oxidoreductase [Alphaproteobacteria bacterium]|nr:NADP-dependent oxidoreductase [Alphaproteobacteria bacterium]